MPPAPKSPSSASAPRKAPKAKGAVRAKSGCYTCRIRRKKCDERPDDQGRCETCVRLRLQCLGFGAKRPDWLRESQNVSDLRDKIKTFLASQGMIKGHSGPSQRSQSRPEESQEERATLKLATEGYPSSASESPPATNLLVLSNEETIRHTQVSNVRGEDGHWGGSSFPTGSNYESHPILHHSPQTAARQESPPFSGGFQEQQYDPSLMTHNSNTIAPPASWLAESALVPVHASSYGPSYSWRDAAIVANFGVPDDGASSPPSIPAVVYTHGANDEWVQRYVSFKVMDKQYQLADGHINKIILETIQSGTARASASLLTTVYLQRTRYLGQVPALSDADIREKYAQLEKVLTKEHHDNNDAVGALNVISTFLFDDGFGDWEGWLELAVKQSRNILKSRRFVSLRDAMLNSTGVEQFIVKTTIWFDVLASVTTMRPPSLYEVIRGLFDPAQATVSEMSTEGDSHALSMMTVMGCEGRIIWALAQISALAQTKQAYARRGALDTMLLVKRCGEIEALLHPPTDNVLENEEPHRRYTSEVFRHAARLYLYTVVHGDFPNVLPIRQAVDQTFTALQDARKYSKEVGQIVIRSTVFAVFMIGCLCTDLDAQKRMFSQLFSQLTDEQTVYGNFKGLIRVMEGVWKKRSELEPKDPVPWREALNASRLLLV